MIISRVWLNKNSGRRKNRSKLGQFQVIPYFQLHQIQLIKQVVHQNNIQNGARNDNIKNPHPSDVWNELILHAELPIISDYSMWSVNFQSFWRDMQINSTFYCNIPHMALVWLWLCQFPVIITVRYVNNKSIIVKKRRTTLINLLSSATSSQRWVFQVNAPGLIFGQNTFLYRCLVGQVKSNSYSNR